MGQLPSRGTRRCVCIEVLNESSAGLTGGEYSAAVDVFGRRMVYAMGSESGNDALSPLVRSLSSDNSDNLQL